MTWREEEAQRDESHSGQRRRGEMEWEKPRRTIGTQRTGGSRCHLARRSCHPVTLDGDRGVVLLRRPFCHRQHTHTQTGIVRNLTERGAWKEKGGVQSKESDETSHGNLN